MDSVLRKLHYPIDEYEMDKLIDTFWLEFELFAARRGPFEKAYIWNAETLARKQSHLWHKIYSLPHTKVLGKVACRVTSKILGIGSAEPAWGDMKHIAVRKRASISTKRAKMQATLFGSACLESARAFAKDVDGHEGKIWTDEDVTFNLGLESWNQNGIPITRRPKRIFNAWYEDWEKETCKKNDPVVEARFLHKYGGLHWRDYDNDDKIVMADPESLEFHRGRGKEGWVIRAIDENNNDEPCCPSLVAKLIGKMDQDPQLNVEIRYPDGYVDSDAE